MKKIKQMHKFVLKLETCNKVVWSIAGGYSGDANMWVSPESGCLIIVSSQKPSCILTVGMPNCRESTSNGRTVPLG